jgi:hypothetical protein
MLPEFQNIFLDDGGSKFLRNVAFQNAIIWNNLQKFAGSILDEVIGFLN